MTMEQLLLEASKQVPALVVLVIVVAMFLRSIERIITSFRETVVDIHKENREDRAQSRAAIQENTLATGRLTEAVRAMTTNK